MQALPSAALAQMTNADSSIRRAAMVKLSFMVSDWSGDASIMTGPGTTLVVRQTERMRYTVGGQAMTEEGCAGRGLASSGGDAGQPHRVLADTLAGHDAERCPSAGKVRLAAAQDERAEVEAILVNEAEVGEGGREGGAFRLQRRLADVA